MSAAPDASIEAGLRDASALPMDAGALRVETQLLPLGSPGQDPQDVAGIFYQTHPDEFDTLVLFYDATVDEAPENYADVQYNDVFGIGYPIMLRHERLSNVIHMAGVRPYNQPNVVEPPHGNAWIAGVLSLLAQEFSHRYAAYVSLDRPGLPADFLLGAEGAHWSFFCDTSGSFMEGTALLDRGDGTYTTGESRSRFMSLDLYLLGLIPPGQVEPFHCVNNPHDFVLPDSWPATTPFGRTPNATWVAAPGVTFAGDRVDITIDDIIAANGPRVPASDEAPHCWKAAFVLVIAKDGSYDPRSLDLVERIRTRWEPFFSDATHGLGRVDTRTTPGLACGAP